MDYKGKLYGHLGNGRYFFTGKTADDWDNLENELKKAKQTVELEKLSAKIETCETILSSYSLTKSDTQSLRQVIKAEKKLRDGFINELKLK